MPEEKPEGKPTLKDKFSSRKFVMTLVAQVINLYLMYSGKITMKVGSLNLVWLTMIYVWGEGFVDSGFLKNKNLQALLSNLLPVLIAKTPNGEEPK